MATVTAEKLVELVRKSQLAEPETLDAALEQIRSEQGGSLPTEAVALAKLLQRKKIVTRWHCEKLLLGKYKGFFLGKHKLLGHIGSGGMSSVYLAEHMKMHDLRAIKVLPQSKLGKSSYLARFQQEAKAIASLNHPNIVRAHDIDNQGDTHYIVMEYVNGDDLQTIVKKKGPLSFEKVATYIAQAARGLQHAHDMGLIHRDVKPANVLINSDGQVKLLDLGLALFTDDAEASLTMDFNDKVLGTADYLAPEQALNSHKVDHRADQYGLGCTMYFLLVGHPPFPDGTIAQRIAKHQKEMPKEIRKLRSDCPGELEGICWKLMQKDAKFRYATSAQAAEVLEQWLVKYRAQLPARVGGGGSSLRLGEESSSGDSRGSSSQALSSVDTVSNRGSDTMAGKSSAISSLSASDSGVLVRVAKRAGASDTSSQIDLASEIARRSQSHAGSSAHGNAPRGSAIHARSVAPARTGLAPGAHAPVASPIAAAKGPRWAWILGLIVMFALAVLLGIVIARLTSPATTPGIQSTSTLTPAAPRLAEYIVGVSIA
ncbi:serine/threonine protein kinase [Aureliella helgolandensis]|uniref:Serine/threonine-protein kinase PrkC n=1 Tax=Aureliella helgolandensis TaxID=2527968 RepID=A0A518GHD4_9BACT|nr:serine/threonine-protein kinase [Aureliella helgolandensis]QDV28005.1 Serine/threonine-protein kinase PrkC [Aureliella helgolandensis]